MPVTVLLIIGLITVIFPLYMTVVIAFKQPSEMTNSISGILSLPKSWSFSNFAEAMEVTDFWHSLGNSILITVITMVLAIIIHSLMGYAVARNMTTKKFYRFTYYYVISGMFVHAPSFDDLLFTFTLRLSMVSLPGVTVTDHADATSSLPV